MTPRSRSIALTIAAVVVGVLLTTAHALTKIPHADEGDLASAAVSLLERSRIAFTMNWAYPESFREHYFSAPFYYWVLAGWFAGFGSTIESYRIFHVWWYLLLVLSWIRIGGGATTARYVYPLVAAAVALNYDIINLGVSRYDIVCAALNAAALASYVHWREKRFFLAIFAANLCLACSAIIHPYAIFGLIGCVALLLASGDFRRLSVWVVALGLLPYLITFGAWALSITDWDVFREQRVLAMSTKYPPSGNLLSTLWNDSYIRWWQLFAGWRSGVPAVMKAKTAFLVLWVLALILVVPIGSKSGRPVRIAMLAYSCGALLLLPFVDPLHLQIYNIHPIAGLCGVTGVVLAELGERSRNLRTVGVAAMLGVAVFACASIGYRVRARELQQEYEVTAALLRRELTGAQYVIAPASFGFKLGFSKGMRVDQNLKSLESGSLPLFIVEDTDVGFNTTPSSPPCRPGVVVHDTTAFAEVPKQIPRHFYRVLRQTSDPRLASDSTTLRVIRNCPRATER